MSFTLRIDDIVDLHEETCIRGRLVTGAYSGPQAIRLTGRTGARRTARIVRHALTGAVGWPIVPDHYVRLGLYIDTPGAPFFINPNSLVEGIGDVPQHNQTEQIIWLSQHGGLADREFEDRLRDWQRRAAPLDRRPRPLGSEIETLFDEIIERFELMN